MNDQPKTTLPEGAALIERAGWDDDGRFTATLVFPSGVPKFHLDVVWKGKPVRIVLAECADAAE